MYVCKSLYLFQNPRNLELKFRETLNNIHGLTTEIDNAEQNNQFSIFSGIYPSKMAFSTVSLASSSSLFAS